MNFRSEDPNKEEAMVCIKYALRTLDNRTGKLDNNCIRLTIEVISKRAECLKPSLTLAISAKAKALIAQGESICSLSAGEPDFETPSFIIKASIKALKEGLTRYGPAAGETVLREAIANKLSTINFIPTKSENVLVTNGGKQAIYNLLQVILDPGDEVIIPSPYWLSYPEITKLAGGIPKIINSSAKEGFSLDLEKLKTTINEKTKLLIINSPCNPTGRVSSKSELEAIADIVRNHPKLMIMSDEIYEFLLTPSTKHFSFAAIAPDLAKRTFTVNGFAKGWAMTGWRIGYLTGDREVIKAATALQSQSTSNVCTFAQYGALAAILGSQDCVKEMSVSYNSRRETLVKGLINIKGLTLIPPTGAFYAFPQLPLECPNSVEFCNLALDKYGLVVIPGKAFGDDRCIRLSCAVSESTISDGINRLGDIISSFK